MFRVAAERGRVPNALGDVTRVTNSYLSSHPSQAGDYDLGPAGLSTPEGMLSVDAASKRYVHRISSQLAVVYTMSLYDEFHLEPQESEHEIWVPACGWTEDGWHDGPLLHRWQGHIVSFLPAGYPARLTVDLRVHYSSDHDLIGELPGFAGRASLVTALRDWVGSAPKAVVWHMSELSWSERVALVLLRMAYPEAVIYPCCKCMPDYKSWPPVWKRTCQNLGLSLYERGQPDGSVLDSAKVVREVMRRSKTDWFDELNKISDVAPRSSTGA